MNDCLIKISVPLIQRFTDTIDTDLYAVVSPDSRSDIESDEVLKIVISKVTQKWQNIEHIYKLVTKIKYW